jgi:hypothetical protein
MNLELNPDENWNNGRTAMRIPTNFLWGKMSGGLGALEKPTNIDLLDLE